MILLTVNKRLVTGGVTRRDRCDAVDAARDLLRCRIVTETREVLTDLHTVDSVC